MNENGKVNYLKRDKGITLIALVVTIIVLIILAGVSINLILGENGIITKATSAKVATEIATMEETARLIYLELTVDKDTGKTQKDVIIEEIVSRLKEEKYDIEKVSTSENAVTGISLSSNAITVSANGTAEIEVEFEGNSDGSNYYAKIDGEYYLMTFNNGVSISKNPTKIEDSSTDTEEL